MAGPKSSFVECVGSAGDVVEVTPWGPLLEMADVVKDMLLDEGFHMEECMTCGMIKAAYKRSHCCGNPSHPFHDMEAGDHRRLSRPSDQRCAARRQRAAGKRRHGSPTRFSEYFKRTGSIEAVARRAEPLHAHFHAFSAIP